ncbi:hypothetical protein VST7929_03027 [Vibrio stylophorae]|uniref:DUF2726 domain-containing protein n=1 Tax=Vibrio stylophorae TaxID=659351 RepID=A0ABM8ZXJ4_9VIBR|nr:DUF2726 domain-containing protein [Vibrio stylophorae]CAH0535453.1 hypothetical protein VST7929_03027 [Vibrio stylophorae]
MFEIILLLIVGGCVLLLVPKKKGHRISRIVQQGEHDDGKKFIVGESNPHSVPHTKQSHLATPNEQNFHQALRQVLPPEYSIHCQVSLMALVKPVHFKDNSKTWSKRMDFVIADADTKVLAVIELDDSSHQKLKRQERDHYVNQALEGHHPLVRFSSRQFYDPAYIANALEGQTDIKCSQKIELSYS